MSRNIKDKSNKGPSIEEVPPWARDNLVIKLLSDYGLDLDVKYDRKYLNGKANRPLIVIKAKPRRKQTYFKWT